VSVYNYLLKSLEALRPTIFHPRGSTDSGLWIRVQPSDFPRLVHHCKRMKSYLTWATMMRMSGSRSRGAASWSRYLFPGTENNWCPRCGADKGWAVKRALRSSFNVWCGVGLARALFRASGALEGRRNFPFCKPEILFSFCNFRLQC